MRWPWQKSLEVEKERAQTRQSRMVMLEKMIALDHERDALAVMVRRSLELLEGKKS